MKIKRICKQCNKSFETYASRLKDGRGIYCSSSCRAKHTGYKLGHVVSQCVRNKIGFKTSQRVGAFANNWKGGKRINKDGYVFMYQPHHPSARLGVVLEHRLIAEKCLDRFLDKTEIVHHINGKRHDNRPENLFVFETNNEHARFHSLTPTNPFLSTWLESNII